MTKKLLFIFAVVIAAAVTGIARYRAPAWDPGPRESYRAFLTSEGVTIAVEPLYTDALAARAFDKKDIITRGITPFAVVIFNDNNFPVEVLGLDVELIHKDRPNVRIKTMPPDEVVWRLSQRNRAWHTQRIPHPSQRDLDRDMLEDFDKKFLMNKTVAAHSHAGGFLYLHLPQNEKAEEFLSGAMLYIPRIFRRDTGARMIYFEIELAPTFGNLQATSENPKLCVTRPSQNAHLPLRKKKGAFLINAPFVLI